MQRPDVSHDDGDQTARNPLADGSRPKATEPNTGLFDIRTLANLTKKRISERMESEHDAEEALLASTHSLGSLSIPEPDLFLDQPMVDPGGFGGGTPMPHMPPAAPVSARAPVAPKAAPMVTEGLAKAVPAVTQPAMTAVAASMPLDRPTPKWVYLAVLAVAVVGIGGFIVYNQMGAKEEAPTMAAEPAAALTAEPAAAAPVAQPLVEPEAQPLADEPPADEPIMDEGAAMVADEDDDKAAKEETKKVYKREDKAKDDGDDAALRAAIDKRKLDKVEAKEAAPVDTSDGKKGIDELLDQAAEGTVLGTKKAEEKKKPTRTELTRSDVKASMGKVNGKAKGCYKLEEMAGTVQIRFTVEPDGMVSKADALSKYKGTPTGECVANAVKGASFPSYDGAPMTFTYPFLLSP